MASIDGVPEPPGGFKPGGWYQGRQYWGGRLGPPGVIINPNQQGYKKPVSKEVVAQTSPKNVSYLEEQKKKFRSTEEVQSFLNQQQNLTYQSPNKLANVPQVSSVSDIVKDLQSQGLLPTSPPPTPPSMAESYKQLREEMGVEDLESSLNDLKAQEEELIATLRQRKTTERGKPVAQNVIAGRIGEVERQESERIDYVRRQIQTKTDQLQTAYTTISTIMQLTQTDYDNARQYYNDQFTKALQTIELVRGIRKDQITEEQRQIDNARANLQIYANAVMSGNIDYNSLDGDQKVMISKLEAQAGLPVGLIANIKKDPKADIIFTTSNEGVTQVGFRNPDGTVTVKSYGKRISGGGSSGNKKLTDIDYKEYLIEDVRKGNTLDSVMKFYSTYLDKDTVLSLYDLHSPYGKHKESPDELRDRYGINIDEY